MSRRRNLFVALEGINGAGKSYLRDVLQDHFESRGEPVFLLGQYGWLVPSATATILAFRERRGGYDEAELLAAHVADRRVTQAEVIGPNLVVGPLIGDRSLISDGPYLEALEGIPAEKVLELYAESGLVFPQLTVFVAVEPAKALDRIDGRGGGRKVYENLEVLKRVSASYERIVESGFLASFTSVVSTDGSRHQEVLHRVIAEEEAVADGRNIRR
ncbi:hypothetical protein ACFYR1_46620 [Streptomyces canus]|uniref:hypothetical protein n=1 Tax=Streptomyces canus TaxID=58343 RepID=UPI0036BAB4B8